MALFSKHCHKIAEAKLAHPIKMSDEEEAEQWKIEQLKAEHEEKVFKAFTEHTDTTTQEEATLLRKVDKIAKDKAEKEKAQQA
eukprot:8165101-Heterocapsa_arctica.AAC.1